MLYQGYISDLGDHTDSHNIRLAVNAVESAVKYYNYLLQRHTSKAKESIQIKAELNLSCLYVKPLITARTGGIDQAKTVGLLYVTWITEALH